MVKEKVATPEVSATVVTKKLRALNVLRKVVDVVSSAGTSLLRAK
jgi:hypothetical protein